MAKKKNGKNSNKTNVKEVKIEAVKEEIKTEKNEVKNTAENLETKTEKNNLLQWVKERPYFVILLIICILLIINIIMVAIGHKAKLVDGKEVVASIEGKEYTAEELFDELKSKYGVSVLVSNINKYIVSKEISDNKKAEEYAKEQISSIKKQYEDMGYDWNETLTSYGYSGEDQLKEEIMNSYKEEEVVIKYLKNKLTEEEIEEYYNNEIFGKYTAKHILIKPDVNDDMTDEEKANAENYAKSRAEEVITRLNNGDNWATLVSEYSNDTGSKDNEGLIENFTKGDVVDEFFDATTKLNDNEYTKEPVKSSYGYHIILKISNTEKESLENVKEEIMEKIVSKKLQENSDLYENSWFEIREAYKITIHDTTIKNAYNQKSE